MKSECQVLLKFYKFFVFVRVWFLCFILFSVCSNLLEQFQFISEFVKKFVTLLVGGIGEVTAIIERSVA